MNDPAFLVHEVMMRDPVTLKFYRVEIEHASQYASNVRIRFYDDADVKMPTDIYIGINDGEVKLDSTNR